MPNNTIGNANHSDNNDVTRLYINSPKTKELLKDFEKVKNMSLMLEEKHKDLLKKIMKNGIKLNILLREHDEKDILTKIKSDESQIEADFHDDR